MSFFKEHILGLEPDNKPEIKPRRTLEGAEIEKIQKYCSHCGALVLGMDKFCGNCGAAVIRIQRVESIKKPQNEDGKFVNYKIKGVPMNWYSFVKNISVLAGGSMATLGLLKEAVDNENGYLVIFAIIHGLLIATLFYGMHKLKIWAWYYLMFYFIIIIPAYAFLTGVQAGFGVAVLMAFAFSLIYSLPNFIYFSKRKHLFK